MNYKIILIFIISILCFNIVNADIEEDLKILNIFYYALDNNSAYDSTNKSNHGTVTSATHSTTDYKLGGGAFDCDGVNDIIKSINFNSLDTFSLSFWFKSQTDETGNYPNMAGIYDPDVSSVEGSNLPTWGDNTLSTQINRLGSWRLGHSAINILGESWTHVAVVAQNGASNLLYLNGTLVKNDGSSDNSNIWFSTPLAYGFCGQSNSVADTGFFQMQIDEISMWNRTINQTEITYLAGGNNYYKSDLLEIQISTYNCTSCYANNTIWQTNTSGYAQTIDKTPTITFNTTLNSNCSIGLFNLNYTNMISNNSDTECSTADTTEHTCTLPTSEQLSYYNNTLYISCYDGITDAASGGLNIYLKTPELISEIINNPHTSNEIVNYISNLSLLGTSITNASCWDYINEDEIIEIFDSNNPTDNITLDQLTIYGTDIGFLDAGEHMTLNVTIQLKRTGVVTDNITIYLCSDTVDNSKATYNTCDTLDIDFSSIGLNYNNYTLDFYPLSACPISCDTSIFIETSETTDYNIKADIINEGRTYLKQGVNWNLQSFEPYYTINVGDKNLTLLYNSTLTKYNFIEDYSLETWHQDNGIFLNNFTCKYDGLTFNYLLNETINPIGAITDINVISPIAPYSNQTILILTNTPITSSYILVTTPNGSTFEFYNHTFINFNTTFNIFGTWNVFAEVSSITFNYTDNASTTFQMTCVESWTCTDYGQCVSGFQSRTCTDSNACGTIINKPITQIECIDTATAIQNIGILAIMVLIWMCGIILGIVFKKGSWVMIASVIGTMIFVVSTDINVVIRVMMSGLNLGLLFAGYDMVLKK